MKLFTSKQLAFRAQLLGIVTGLFTDDEFEYYLSEKVNLDKRIANKIKLPVHVADDPLRSVVRGTGMALKHVHKYPFLMQ